MQRMSRRQMRLLRETVAFSATRRPGSQAFLIAAYVALAAGIVLPAAKTFPPKV